MQKKVLIFHTSVGLGHQMIAENIGYYLSQAGYEIKVEDILKVQAGRLVNFGIALHRFINQRLPFVWSWLYKSKAINALFAPFRVPLAARNYHRAEKLIEEFGPDLVICTQTTASAILAFLKRSGRLKAKFAIAFSDYHIHPFWLYKEADFYLANIDEQKQEMVRRGYPGGQIYVCGMTVKPKMPFAAEAVRKKLGIPEEKPVVLVGVGSLGIGLDENMLQDLLSRTACCVVAVCGKNQELLGHLSRINHPNLKVLGFYSPMQELYAIADVFVTKPGGLTTAESLQWCLPMIVTHWLPGQEELNISYLEKRRLIIARPADLIGAVHEELKGKTFKNQLSVNPNAAKVVGTGREVLEAVNNHLQDRRT